MRASSGPEVTRLQEQLNQYRGRSVPPLAALPANGNYDSATRGAVRDYQRVNHLPVTGETSPAMQTPLQLRNDANFRHLGTTTQDDVLGRVMHAPTPEARGNIVRLATEPGFSQLNRGHQALMLERQTMNATDPRATDGLIHLSQSPQFRSLNDDTRNQVIDAYGAQSQSPDNIPRYTSMVTHPNFGRMNPAQQLAAVTAFTGSSPAGQAAFNRLLTQRPEVLTPATLGHLASMSPNSRPTIGSTLEEIADPDRQINQGAASPYCSVSNMSHRLATENPAEYVRLTTELTNTGHATTVNGAELTRPTAAETAGAGPGRSEGESVLQGALYNQGRAVPMSHDELGLAQSFGPGQPGLSSRQQAVVAQGLFAGRTVHFASQDASLARMNRGFDANDRVMAGLDFRTGNRTASHEVQMLPRNQPVNGQPQDPAFIYYRDPTGHDADRLSAPLSPRSEAATPADPSNGLRRMARGEFESALRNLVVTR